MTVLVKLVELQSAKVFGRVTGQIEVRFTNQIRATTQSPAETGSRLDARYGAIAVIGLLFEPAHDCVKNCHINLCCL
ncbi:hypothetical protein BH10CYA1_BH10CYA1_13410 [soil metagenome]